MEKGLGEKLIKNAWNGRIEYLLDILNKDANIVDYTDEVVLIFF